MDLGAGHGSAEGPARTLVRRAPLVRQPGGGRAGRLVPLRPGLHPAPGLTSALTGEAARSRWGAGAECYFARGTPQHFWEALASVSRDHSIIVADLTARQGGAWHAMRAP